MSYQLKMREDGLRIATEPLAAMESVALAFSVDVGARWESETQHGISHLLEHMAFKGTPTRSALEIAEAFDAIGGHFNAFTSHEHTVYYAKVLREHWPLACDMLCDILQHSLFDADELDREKQVILQELAAHHDTPDDLVFDQFQEAAFGAQSLGRSILGTAETIQSHPREALDRFVATHYQPHRIVVTAAGALDPNALHAQLAQQFTLADADRSANPSIEYSAYRGGESRIARDLEQLQLIIGMESVPIGDPDYYAVQLLSILLGGGMSSRLFQEVREKRGLVYTIQSMNASYAECGIFSIYAATGAGDAVEMIPVMCDQLLAVTSQVSEAELQRAKQQQIANLRMARESTATLAEWMGRHLLHYGEYRTASDLQSRLEAVDVAHIERVAKRIFLNPTLTLAALGPIEHVPALDAITARLRS